MRESEVGVVPFPFILDRCNMHNNNPLLPSICILCNFSHINHIYIFTTQFYKRLVTPFFVFSNHVQSNILQLLLYNTPLSWRKYISSLCLVLFLVILPTKSVALIPYILHTVGSWIIPDGVESFFLH